MYRIILGSKEITKYRVIYTYITYFISVARVTQKNVVKYSYTFKKSTTVESTQSMSTVKKIHIYYRILPTNVPLKVTICSHFKCVNVNQIFRLSKFKKSMKHSQYSTNPKVVGSTLSICYPAIMSLSKTPIPQFLLNGKTIF